MKRNSRQSSTIFSALGFAVILSVPALASASQSGSLILSGTVAAYNDIEVTPNGTNNTTLNITAGGQNVNVASVQETSNDSAGYKITVQSLTGGYLALGGGASSTTAKTAYQISYNGGAMVTPTTNATTIKTVNSLTQQTTATSAVTVNVTAYPSAMAGTYSDTLTLAIVAN